MILCRQIVYSQHLLPSTAAGLSRPAPNQRAFRDGELRHLRDLVTVLTSSAGLFGFTDLTGSTPEEAAATVAWVIRRLLGLDERTAGRRSTQSTAPASL